jgi:WD40 repeat protein
MFLSERANVQICKVYPVENLQIDLPHFKFTNMHFSKITAMCVSEPNQMLLTGSKDGDLKLWDLTDMNCLTGTPIKIYQDIHASDITSIALDPFDIFVVTSGKDNLIKFFNLHNELRGTKKLKKTMQAGGADEAKAREALGMYKSLGYLRSLDNEPLFELSEAHGDAPKSLIVTKDKKLISADMHGELKTWDLNRLYKDVFHQEGQSELQLSTNVEGMWADDWINLNY